MRTTNIMRDYQLVSPSLEGILSHSSMAYEGISRPLEVLKFMDGPSTRGNKKGSDEVKIEYTRHDHNIIERYFHDVYGIFMKKLSNFVVSSEAQPDEVLQLQAMLQEMIKVKQLLNK